jgi:hypothetical protein
LSEWRILADAADGGHAALVGAICVALAIAFIALSMHLSGMLFGTSSRASDTDVTVRSRFSLLAVPGFLFAASLYLGLMLNSQIMMIAGRIGR